MKTSNMSVIGEKKGPLPRPRQTNNRAELFAMIDAVARSDGDLIFWTDSEVLCKGWAECKHNYKAFVGGNSDLWYKLGQAVEDRSYGVITVKHIESHIKWDEAKRK